MRTIRLFVYDVPLAYLGSQAELDKGGLVSTTGGVFRKLPVGWVKCGGPDDEIVKRFAETGRLPQGVDLKYIYQDERKF